MNVTTKPTGSPPTLPFLHPQLHSTSYLSTHLFSFDSQTLKLDSILSFEMSGNTRPATQSHIPQDKTLQIVRTYYQKNNSAAYSNTCKAYFIVTVLRICLWKTYVPPAEPTCTTTETEEYRYSEIRRKKIYYIEFSKFYISLANSDTKSIHPIVYVIPRMLLFQLRETALKHSRHPIASRTDRVVGTNI